MGLTRGSLTLPRLTAHRAVIVAASLTVVVAAALAAALAVFSGQALPRAVRHDLSVATGTQLIMSGSLDAAQAAQYDATLPGLIKTALRGAPFTLARAVRSDPLGFVPGALPAQPASAGNTPIAEAAGLQDITAQAVLTAGRWPGAPTAGQPVPAALPATAAALLHVTDGDVLRMKDRITGRYVRFVITGLYRPRQVSAPYWALSDIASSGSSTAAGFTSYGPLTVQAAAFAGPLAVSAGSWLAEPRTASIPAGQLTTVAANVVSLRQALEQAEALAELTVGTSLPAVLDGTASNLDVARSLLAICAVLLFLVAAAALLAMARLLAAQREGETAMLVARGATRRQLVRLSLAEAVPLCALSAAAGGVLGVLLARLLTGAGGGAGDAWAPAAAIAVTAAVIMVLPVLRTATPGMARVRRGRQAALSAVSRSGADLALVLLAVVAAWQLRHYSAASAGANGTFGVDPVVVVAPALALAGGTVLALRLLPLGGKAGDRLAARGRRLTAALASWQISRQPIRQGGAALLIVLAVATGTLTLAQRQSWTRSGHDQASFAAGADVRVEASQALTPAQAGALAGLPGVRHAMPVATFPEPATGGETVAVDAGQAADVTLLRADQTPLRPAALFRAITPAGPGTGLTLPGRATEVRLTMRLGPAALRLAPATVSVSVEDADSNVYELDAGPLPADGREHTLAVSLADQTVGAGQAAPAGAVYPLRLTGVGLSYTMPARRPGGPAVFVVTSVSGGPGLPEISGAALRGWLAVASSAELEGVRQTTGTQGPSGLPALSPAAGAGAAAGAGPGAPAPLTVRFSTGYGLASSGITGSPPSPVGGQLQVSPARPAVAIPGLATRGFLAANNASVGSTVQADINGAAVGVHIVGAIATFPTVSAGGGALVVDLGSVQAFLAGGAYQPAQATQWWLADPAGPPAGLDGVLPPGSAVTSAAATAARLTGNPLSAVPQRALLAIAIAAAVLAGTGFGVSIAAGLRLRRAENALLAALGVERRAAAGQLCLEKLMLSAPSALAGLALGAVLSELLVPAITLSPSATLPVPPVLIEFGWAQTLPLALAVAVLPVLAAALTIARRPDAAAELRAAEAA